MMGRQTPISVKNAALLYAFPYLDKQQRKALLRKADPALIKSICECALNTISGNIALTKAQKKNLCKHASCLRKLSESKGSWKSKKRLVIQKGGFLLPLLSVVGSVLASVLSQST